MLLFCDQCCLLNVAWFLSQFVQEKQDLEEQEKAPEPEQKEEEVKEPTEQENVQEPEEPKEDIETKEEPEVETKPEEPIEIEKIIDDSPEEQPGDPVVEQVTVCIRCYVFKLLWFYNIENRFQEYHTEAKTHFLSRNSHFKNVNFVKNEISEMWILWKLMF